jgi:hypothetical protein
LSEGSALLLPASVSVSVLGLVRSRPLRPFQSHLPKLVDLPGSQRRRPCAVVLGSIKRRCGVTVLVKLLTRKFFLGPDSGNSNMLLLLLNVKINVT